MLPQIKIGETISFDSHQTQKILPFRIPAAVPFHSGSSARCILFFAVEVSRIIIAGIRLGDLVGGYDTNVHFFDTSGTGSLPPVGSSGAPTATSVRVPPLPGHQAALAWVTSALRLPGTAGLCRPAAVSTGLTQAI